MTAPGAPVLIILQPAVVATAVLAIVLVLIALGLSRLIKRRELPPLPVEPVQTRTIQPQRIQRATSAELPDNIKERLRYLSGETTATASPTAGPTPRATTRPPAPQAPATEPAPRTDVIPAADNSFFFSEDAQPRAGEDDRTTRFDRGAVDEDRTRFFGAAEDETDDHFFSDEDTSPGFSIAGSSNDGDNVSDATRFFDMDDEHEGDFPVVTEHFGRDFGQEIENPDDGLVLGPHDGTNMLQALPPLDRSADADRTGDRPIHTAGPRLVDTGPLQALPPSPGSSAGARQAGTSGLDVVHGLLEEAAMPDVLALSVLDLSGKVLAGEADENLAGELRLLMSEQRNKADATVEQPVKLADDSLGTIVLMPAGANMVLGALVLEEGDDSNMRTRLRGLAHQIGDAMRRAS